MEGNPAGTGAACKAGAPRVRLLRSAWGHFCPSEAKWPQLSEATQPLASQDEPQHHKDPTGASSVVRTRHGRPAQLIGSLEAVLTGLGRPS